MICPNCGGRIVSGVTSEYCEDYYCGLMIEKRRLYRWISEDGYRNPPPEALIRAAFPKIEDETVDYFQRKPMRINESLPDAVFPFWIDKKGRKQYG